MTDQQLHELTTDTPKITPDDLRRLRHHDRIRLLSVYRAYDLVEELKRRKDELETEREELAEFCGFNIKPLNKRIEDFLDKYQFVMLTVFLVPVFLIAVCAAVMMIYKTIGALS